MNDNRYYSIPKMITIPLPEYDGMGERIKGLESEIEELKNKAFFIEVNTYLQYENYFSELTKAETKRFVVRGKDELEAILNINIAKYEHLESENKRLKDEIKELENKPEPWYKFW